MDIEQTLKQAVKLGIKGKFSGVNTKITVNGLGYYAMFSYRPIPKKCSKCGQDIKEWQK